ncbi:MAG: carboxylesterase [Xanthomonadaceae bacterium]|nr:carboxylesterase [Xanthomonadaceae bacterium]
MNDIQTELLDCVVTETGPSPEYAIIWLHGLGADGNDFAPIVPQLRSAQSRAVRFVFPHAPVRAVTVNNGMSMRAWYDILGFEISRDQDAAGIRQSLDEVQKLVQRELERGIRPERLLLAGFSQGGAIALRLGLAQQTGLGGVIALSCYLLQADGMDSWLTEAGATTPVFMAHGSRDPIVPIQLGRQSAELLARANVPVEWSEWNMQHAVNPEEILAMDRWIEDRFSVTGA